MKIELEELIKEYKKEVKHCEDNIEEWTNEKEKAKQDEDDNYKEYCINILQENRHRKNNWGEW